MATTILSRWNTDPAAIDASDNLPVTFIQLFNRRTRVTEVRTGHSSPRIQANLQGSFQPAGIGGLAGWG